MESADCIPHDQVPETDDEILDILSTHGVLELSEFIENIGSMKAGNDPFRAFETVVINNKNLGDFLSILDELSNCWDETADEEESAPDLTGKNVVIGNGTLN